MAPVRSVPAPGGRWTDSAAEDARRSARAGAQPAAADADVDRPAAHARHRLVQRRDRVAHRRCGDSARQSQALRCIGAVRYRRAREAGGDHHRRRLVRQADAARARASQAPVRSLFAGDDRVVGRHVEPGDERRAAQVRAAAHPDRLARIVGGDRHGAVDHHRCRVGADGQVPALGYDAVTRRNTAGDRRQAGLERARRCRWTAFGRLLQGSGEERAHVRRHTTADSRYPATGRR